MDRFLTHLSTNYYRGRQVPLSQITIQTRKYTHSFSSRDKSHEFREELEAAAKRQQKRREANLRRTRRTSNIPTESETLPSSSTITTPIDISQSSSTHPPISPSLPPIESQPSAQSSSDSEDSTSDSSDNTTTIRTKFTSRIPRHQSLIRKQSRASTSTHQPSTSTTTTTQTVAMSMNPGVAISPPSMPFRGHASAPRFEGNNPRKLQCYFEALEFLFTTCAVIDNDLMKKYTVRYVDIDTEDGWKQLPEFTTGNYTQFKAAIFKLYPGADGERKWTISDLDHLTGEWSRVGFRNKEELGNYHRKFLVISGFLKSKNRMSENEVKRAFVHGFPMDFWNRVLARLQIKKPDSHPDDPWDVEDVYSATEFILHGSTPIYSSTTSAAPPTTTPVPDNIVKKEELFSILEQFSQTIAKAIEAKSPSQSASSKQDKRLCFYDGGDHPARQCETLNNDLKNGFCKRDAITNRLTLPDGSPILRSLHGNNLAERVANWNKDNPGRAKASVNFFSIADISHQSHHQSYSPSTNTFAYEDNSSRKRIEELEREVYELRKRQIVEAVEIPRQTRQSARQAPQQEASSSQPKKSTPQTQSKPTQDKAQPKEKTPEKAPSPSKPDNTNAPIHPYAAATENAYLPPHERNFASKPPKDKDAAYRTQAPIQSPVIVNEVYSKTMKSPCITLTPEEILSIAPDVRTKVREVITPKRVSNKPSQPVSLNDNIKDDTLPFAHIEDIAEDSDEDIPNATTSDTLYSNSTPPPDTIVAIDPFDVYLQNLNPDQIPKHFIVAKESFSLRSILMRINFRDNIEAVVDPGSSIVSMSEAVAIHLRLSYDPTVFINMESANGTLDRTLGLARNVHCKIGGINLYLQVHVVRDPAYDILLGRPFDVLTRSTIQNFPDGNQTVTIHDPNSGYVATVPTFPRNKPRFTVPKADFANDFDATNQDFPQ